MLLLYFANITRKFEKENYSLKNQINFTQDQISINELEFSIFNNYEYLIKMQRIYFDKNENIDFNNRLSFNQYKDEELIDIYKVGIR